MSELYRLVYYSKNRDGAERPADVEGILAKSRANNAAAGVSGALIFNSGFFGQVLEGSRHAVETTFERIQRDERHGDVSLLHFGPVDARGFGTWSMAFVGADPEDAERYGSIGARSGFDPSAMTGEHLFAALHDLAFEEERA